VQGSGEALPIAAAPYLLILGAFTIPLLSLLKPSKNLARFFTTFLQLVVLVLVLSTFISIWEDTQVITYTFSGFPPPVGITYVVDHAGVFMALVTSVLFVIITPLSKFFMDDEEYYYAFVLGLESGLLGIILTGDIFNLFVMMEVTLVASYVLISSLRTRDSIRASFKYAMIGAAAGMFFFLASVLYYFSIGSLNIGQGGAVVVGLMESMGRVTEPRSTLELILNIALWSLIAEAAVTPLHFWLPDAYSSSPIPIAALMAALSEGVAFYVLIRLYYIVLGGLTIEAVYVLSVLGLLTILVGGFGMLYSDELMKIVSYSVILDVGYISLALSLGSEGITTALAYVLAHAVVKPTLFLSAGWLVRSSGRSRLKDLSGSFRGDPPLFFGFLIASVAVVGIPPTILFQAKFRLYELVLAEVMGSGSIYYALALVVMLLGSLLALAGFLKVVQTTYLTPGESVMKSPKYLSVLIGILGIATIVLGLTYTSVENEVIRRVANSFLAGRMEYINEVIKLLSSG